MTKNLRIYIWGLLIVISLWAWYSAPTLAVFVGEYWGEFLGIAALYLCSHVLRMIRLVLLMLDERKNVFSLISAHALTALPSSFIPFKLGEFLRLSAFFYTCDTRQKAIAIWLTERFGDVFIITIFIFSLYLLNIKVPPEMRVVFILFLLVSGFSLFGLFALANAFTYLNRHLILSSLSSRGLLLLRVSNAVRNIESNIRNSIEGRLTGFLLLSSLIWIFELLAIYFFIKLLTLEEIDFAQLFSSGVLLGLSQSSQNTFGLYQSFTLVVLTIVFLLAVWLISRIKIKSI